MNTDLLFQIGNMIALLGWVVLLASPWLPELADRMASFIIPGVLAIAYAGIVMAFWAGAEGGYSSLNDVSLLFQSRELLLAGWLHFLAFDLFIGAWEVRKARQVGLPFPLVVLCLLFTFLFGPAGLLVFLVLWGLRVGMLRVAGHRVPASCGGE